MCRKVICFEKFNFQRNIFLRHNFVDLRKIKIGGDLFSQDEYRKNGIGKLHFYADGEGEYGV